MFDKCYRLMTEHPKSVGESYFSHLLFTLKCSLCLLKSSGALLVHGFFPFLFQHYTSDNVSKLNEEFQAKRRNCCEQ